MENITKQLKQGDIIMHHSHGWLSNLIRKLDGSHFNHCSVYDKDGYLYESVKDGITRKTIENSIETQDTYSITILRSKNLTTEKAEKLIEIIKNYELNSFAHTQIFFLAGILWMRKKKFHFILERIVNVFLILFEKIITKVWDRKNKNMICSELVYRAYMDTAKYFKDPNLIFHIPIECNPILYNHSRNGLEKYACYDFETPKKTKQNSIETIKENLKDFFDASIFDVFSFTKYASPESDMECIEKKIKKVATILRRKEFYNFITPADIFRSLDTYPIATFKTKKALNNLNYEVCN